jgi:hypothetical protein
VSQKAAWVLRASVVFTVWVWVVLIRNMVVGNYGVSFRLIHIGLGIVALAFAVATWKITSDSRRYTRAVERERQPERMKSATLAVGTARLGWRKAVGALSGEGGSGETAPTTVSPAEAGPQEAHPAPPTAAQPSGSAGSSQD